ncbi:uncharacterized protein LOC111637387 [Centruroides sculpturatus]|uniref:uncharacterized protein LOC111637387 n=1 Tax=Centruroides sculpturatus TaxID=218467 RepID=UPI000C6EA1DB|nr:uncharacterized protein LOC111637387 [Centruroides sculpturatus]
MESSTEQSMNAKSYLVFDYKVNNLLFYNLSISSVEEMLGICLMVSLMVLLYETIKIFRKRVLQLLENNERIFKRKESPSITSEKAIIAKVRRYSVQDWKRLVLFNSKRSEKERKTLCCFCILSISD